MGVVIPQENIINFLVQLRASHHVIGQICQTDLGCRPDVANGFDVHGVHRVGEIAKHVLNSGTGTGLLSVRGLLGFGELMVPVAFLLNHIRHAAACDRFFLSDIGGVCVQLLTFIART